jgi:hypothetical protein
VKELAAMKGDAERGKAVFASRAAGCIKCHRFAVRSGQMWGGFDDDPHQVCAPELLDAILNPSASAFGYEPWIVKVKGGAVYSGFIFRGRHGHPQGKRRHKRAIPAKDITLRKKQTLR